MSIFTGTDLLSNKWGTSRGFQAIPGFHQCLVSSPIHGQFRTTQYFVAKLSMQQAGSMNCGLCYVMIAPQLSCHWKGSAIQRFIDYLWVRGTEGCKHLMPHLNWLLSPIFTRPLWALPLSTQIVMLSNIWLFNTSWMLYWICGIQSWSSTWPSPGTLQPFTLTRLLSCDWFSSVLSCWCHTLVHSDIVAIYTFPSVIDLSGLTNFLYQHVAMNWSDSFQCNFLLRCLIWFRDPSPSFGTLLTQSFMWYSPVRKRLGTTLTGTIINHIHTRIWQPMSNSAVLPSIYADALFWLPVPLAGNSHAGHHVVLSGSNKIDVIGIFTIFTAEYSWSSPHYSGLTMPV